MGGSTIWGIHGVFTGYSRGIHMYRLCIGYVSVMCRLCVGADRELSMKIKISGPLLMAFSSLSSPTKKAPQKGCFSCRGEATHRRNGLVALSRRGDSNARPPPPERAALPTALLLEMPNPMQIGRWFIIFFLLHC